jgi:cation diffusion facilitator family transporter
MDHTRLTTRVAALSVASNTLLVVLKVVVGLAIGSVSVLSEAIHSGLDLVAAVIAFAAVRTSGKAADDNHPFGHGKIENIAGTIEAVLILAAALWIAWEAVEKLIHPTPVSTPGWGVAVMAVSAAVNFGVSTMLFRVGKATQSVALQADAWHLRTDVWTSVGVLVGLAVMWLGGKLLPGVNLAWVDPVAALAVAVLIGHASWELTVQAGRDLLDARLPPVEEQSIRDEVARHCPEAVELHGLRTRKAGATRFIEFHLVVPGHLTVEVSHQATDRVEDALRRILPGSHITIHVEPCGRTCHAEQCPGTCPQRGHHGHGTRLAPAARLASP